MEIMKLIRVVIIIITNTKNTTYNMTRCQEA